jgi:hypothetical protein
MMYYYIKLLIKSWWPNGKLVTASSPRTEEEKLSTRYGGITVVMALPYHRQLVAAFSQQRPRFDLRIC